MFKRILHIHFLIILTLLLTLPLRTYSFTGKIESKLIETTTRSLFPSLLDGNQVIATIHAMTGGIVSKEVFVAASLGLSLQRGTKISQQWFDEAAIDSYRARNILENLGIEIGAISWEKDRSLENIIAEVARDINKAIKIAKSIQNGSSLSSQQIAFISAIRSISISAAVIIEQAEKEKLYSDLQVITAISALIELTARLTGPFDTDRMPYTDMLIEFKNIFRKFIEGEFTDDSGNLASYLKSFEYLELMLAYKWHLLPDDKKVNAEFTVAKSVMNLMTIYETHGILSETQARAIDVGDRIAHIESLAQSAINFFSQKFKTKRKF